MFVVGSIQNLHIDINKVVHLRDSEDVKVLMDEEKLYLMISGWVFEADDQDIHDCVVDIKSS
jgi:hypothetical protein